MITRLLTTVVLLLLCLPVTVQANSGKVYVWRDANGVLVFSDSPKPGAEEVNLTTKINLMETAPSFRPPPSEASVSFTVEITNPEQEATIRDNTGTVHVAGRALPRYPRGFQISLLLNGEPYQSPQTGTNFVLRDLERGEHHLQMELLDQNGKLIAKSEVITFYLHRATVIPPR
ncbi:MULTISPECIES: DUF4124 domain-containing protein [Alkalimonas]|uniref:DUF4124 domain-containing protein n=1 Tax=Alkalimonas mucilaginosa TaxID=3057676 RepID=A0ABU7JEH6_9GAMM|nr:DUF4124 domain-containing protein [Alkalimonas sp. MEB004]MEE2024022.1 DUF4124 domain-containing protein [Alkalimonas sp. MEB004]